MTEKTGIIYLHKDKFDFYTPQMGKVIEFLFVPEIIHDLEVVNSELLENLIKLFIDNNKITPTDLILVLSDNSCFIKDFVIPQASPLPQGTLPTTPIISNNDEASKKMEEDIKSFIDHIPFENVQSKDFPTGNGKKVLAVNKDFYDSIKNAFDKLGFKISAVYPGIVFANNIGAQPIIDMLAVNSLLQQSDSQRSNNLLINDRVFVPIVEKVKEGKENKTMVVEEVENKPVKKSNKRLFMMIGIFVVLIIILVFVYIGSLQQQP